MWFQSVERSISISAKPKARIELPHIDFPSLDGKTKSYCTPESYQGQSGTLYRNKGDGTFEDVTRKAGLEDPTAKALGVALLDFDNDGWLDLFVSNDTQPNRLYRNKQDGTFCGMSFCSNGQCAAGANGCAS